MKNNLITESEINLLKEKVSKDIEFREEFPRCVIFNQIRLPNSWSKPVCPLMLTKDEDSWTAFIDSDIQTRSDRNASILSPYSNEGWCELVLEEKEFIDPIKLIDYLKEKMEFNFDVVEEPEQNQQTDIGIIKDVVIYQNKNNINFLFEYLGPSTIVTQEIFDLSNKLVRNLEVVEKSEGWSSQIWDGKDNDGNEIPNGIYFLKFRSAQDLGEIIKVVLIHKNFDEKVI